jgi:hypothetical protein
VTPVSLPAASERERGLEICEPRERECDIVEPTGLDLEVRARLSYEQLLERGTLEQRPRFVRDKIRERRGKLASAPPAELDERAGASEPAIQRLDEHGRDHELRGLTDRIAA